MEKNTHEEKTEDEINILDYLIVLAKYKKKIIIATLTVAFITILYTLTLPNIYKAEAMILTPGRSGSGWAPQILRQFGVEAGFFGTAFSLEQDIFVYILYTSPVYDRIIDRFGLIEEYETEDREEAREMLAGMVTAETMDNFQRIIKISVNDKDPQLAADMANAFVEALKYRVQELAVTEASQRRLFFEEQLKQVKEALIESEDAMREFQEKTGVLKIEVQAGAVLESIANLRALIAAKEVELKVMRTYSTPNNPDLQKVEETLKGLKVELAKLEEKGGSNPDPLMPAGRMPAVGMEYARKLRELRYNEKLFQVMASQYELARIEEGKDPAIIQVLEEAIPTEERAGPERKKKVLIATFVTFFLSVFAAFFMEYLERASLNKEDRDRMKTLKRYLSFKRKK